MDGCRICPNCGSRLTRPTVHTTASVYCFCDGCGHAWRDRREPETPREGTPLRRRTDAQHLRLREH